MLETLHIEMLDIVLAGVIICLGMAVQSAVGFGSALFAIPLLVWIGIPLPNVIALVATCSMVQAVIGVRVLKADVPWRLSFTAIAVMMAGLFVGLFMLGRLVTLGPDMIRAVMGGFLCLLVGIQAVWRPKPVASMHWGWGTSAFLCSGFLGGVCGMNGPPLVAWSMAHDWSTRKTRGFLFAFFAMANPVQIILLSLTFGTSVLWSVVLGIAFLPLVYVGSSIGLPIGNSMSKERLRQLAFLLLLVIGISSVVPVFIKG